MKLDMLCGDSLYPVEPRHTPQMSIASTPSCKSAQSSESLGFGYSTPLPQMASSSPYATPVYNHAPVATPKTSFSANGVIRNMPENMLNDQFGIGGLMIGRKLAETGRVPVTYGEEIFSPGFLEESVNPQEPVFTTYGGPFSRRSEPASLRVDNPNSVPNPDYLVAARMIGENHVASMETLRSSWSLRVDQYNDDVLFYMFYTFPSDVLQLVAAANLFKRGWRYHTEFKVWLQRVSSQPVPESGGTSERGIFKYFEYNHWKVVQRELVIDHNKLEGAPNISPEVYQYHFVNRD